MVVEQIVLLMITESRHSSIFQSQISSRLTENILKLVIPRRHQIQAGEGSFRSFSDAKSKTEIQLLKSPDVNDYRAHYLNALMQLAACHCSNPA